jgi:hypothetical protein
MKGKSFSIPNTGKSPIHSGIKHSASGANVPASYAHQQSVVARIAAKSTHIKKGGW